MDPLLATILMFGSNFAPVGWAFCSGQLLSISQNTAVFSLLGTTYGGNGVQNFALPDLRGRFAVGQGQGPGLQNYILGQTGGVETNTLSVANLPAHSHLVNAVGAAGAETAPGPNLLAATAVTSLEKIYSNGAATTTMSPAMIAMTGNGAQVENRSPYLAVSFIIAMQGIFPTRN